MAENKKSFLLYCDLIHTVEHLSDEDAGKVLKWVLDYVNDGDPEPLKGLLAAVCEPIKQQLKRDLKKYESIVDRNSKNGAKGGRPKKPKKPTGLIGLIEKPKEADSDTDTDTDSVSETDNVKETLLNNLSWLENIAMKKRIDLDKVKTYLIAFLDDLELKDDLDRPEKDIKQHFVNLLNIELKKEAPVKLKPNYKI